MNKGHDFETRVSIPTGHVALEGELIVPDQAHGMVLFAHGSGSSRHSPRNRFVAAGLHNGNLGTLLFDLLTADEEVVDLQTTGLRFNVALLAERLVHAIDWMSNQAPDLPIGLFGSSTGAGAALLAAAQRPEKVHAVVSRGGRPDLAASALQQVKCPVLLIVGERDTQVIELNRQALEHLHAAAKMEIVPRATHLFEEPGALDEVVRHACDWFDEHLVASHGVQGVQGVN